MTSLRERLDSPRRRRRLLVLALVGVALAVAVGVVALVGDTGEKVDDALTKEPAIRISQGKKAPLPPEARKVAGEFILTAVARKDLAKSWVLTHPSLRQGLTKKQWLSGDIPVIPYPVSDTETAPLSVEESYADYAVMRVALAPQKGSGVKPQIFFIGVRAVGKGADRHWLVDYWGPYATVPIPSASAS